MSTRPSHFVWSFWGAVVVALVLPHVPFGPYVLYPFSLLATWAHELGHGLAAILVGGEIDHIALYANLGGSAASSRPDWALAHAFIAAGGLVGPALAGGGLIILGARPRAAVWALDALAVCLILSALLWIRNPFGFAAILALGATAGAIAHFAPNRLEIALVQFAGIRLCLDSLSDVDYMFTRSFVRNGQVLSSDTQTITEHLFLPYWVWGTLIAALCLGILVGSFYLAWGRRA